MPTLYESALLAKMSYGTETDAHRKYIEDSHWTLLFDSETEAFETTPPDNSKLGYRGKCFSKRAEAGDTILVFSHRGTVTTDVDNLISDCQLVSNKVPAESHVALQFTQHCQEKIKNSAKTVSQVLHAGHSLGGVHAHFCAYSLGHFAIGFDNPGVLDLVRGLGVPIDGIQPLRHLSILSEPNVVNTHGARFGRVYQKVVDQTRSKSSVSNLESHGLSFLINTIPRGYTLDPFDQGFKPPVGFRAMQKKRPDGSSRGGDKPIPYNIGRPEVFSVIRTDGSTEYRMHSEIASTKEGNPEIISNRRTLVHLLCSSGVVGHSKIIVERLDNQGVLEISYHDLVVDQSRTDNKVTIRSTEHSYHKYANSYDPTKTASFQCVDEGVDLVEAMIKSIKRDVEEGNIEYTLWGGGLFEGAPDVVRDNCCSWAIKKLAIAGIRPNITPVLAAVPGKVETHGVRDNNEESSSPGVRLSDSNLTILAQAKKGYGKTNEPDEEDTSKRTGEWCGIL